MRGEHEPTPPPRSGRGRLYGITILPSAQRKLDRLPAKVQLQIDHRIRDLATQPEPPNSQSLTGSQFRGLRKIRSGDYRIVYQVRHAQVVIVIVMIGNRKEIYDLLRRHLA